MRSRLERLGHLATLALVPLAVAVIPAVTRADVPPPPHLKRVSYSFRIDGIARFPGYALIVYPCSLSNGRPVSEYHVLADGEVKGVGRRGGSCSVYAVPRAVVEELQKSPMQVLEKTREEMKPILDKGVACEGGPNPIHTVSVSDSRDQIIDYFEVTSIDAKKCKLTQTKGPPATP